MNHIEKINFSPATGVVVESVKFSKDVRIAVCHTAKSLLSEVPFHSTPDVFTELYFNIKKVFDYWNSNNVIYAHMVRNAIRVLDMRIEHCQNSLKEGDWKEIESHGWFVPIGNQEKKNPSFVKKGDYIMVPVYNGNTMEAMVATRQILVDSLIIISPEFE
jgi:hypothetical protein